MGNKKVSIMVSCQKATSLAEKGRWTRLTFKERVQLKMHDSICAACKKFEHQGMMIEQAMERLSQKVRTESLSEERKQEIIQRLHNAQS